MCVCMYVCTFVLGLGDYTLIHETNQRITSSSYSNRVKADKWTVAETDLFFKSLSQYGTDFTLLSQLFPARTRKQLKNKFKKEERENYGRLEGALRKRIPIGGCSFWLVRSFLICFR